MAKPIHIHDAEFHEKVLNSKIPVVVDFWTLWCAPCKMIAPVLEDIAKQYDGKVIVAKVNTDEDFESAALFGVQGVPTLLFMDNGQVKDRQVGAAPVPLLKEKVDSLLMVSTQAAA